MACTVMPGLMIHQCIYMLPETLFQATLQAAALQA